MVYTVPHFDVHFYTITPAERDAIVLGNPELAAKMSRQPTPELVPAGYVPGMSTPGMGQHWRDPSAPELNGQPFTRTFLYGSYDGALTFWETMVAKAYLETKPAGVPIPIKLPARYASTGYYPTSYAVGYDAAAKEYRLALSGLVGR